MNKGFNILIVLLFPLLLLGQEGLQLFEFSDGRLDYFSNKVTINCFLEKDGVRSALPESRRLEIDLTGVKEAFLIVRFSNFILDKNAEAKTRQARLIVKDDYVSVPPNLELNRFTKASLAPGEGKSKDLKLKIKGNSNGILHIQYAVTTATYSINKIEEKDKKSYQRTVVTKNFGTTTTAPIVINEPSNSTDGTSGTQDNPDNSNPTNTAPKKKPTKKSSKPAAPKKSEEELAWEKIENSTEAQVFADYLKEYGDDAQFRQEAIARFEQFTPMQVEVRKVGEVYAINISHTKNPEVNREKMDSAVLNQLLISDERIKTEHFFEVQMEVPGKYDIPIIDEWGKEAIVDLENIMEASLDSLSETDYQLTIQGGIAPFQVEFIKQGNLYADYALDFKDKTYQFNKDDLADRGLAGTYKMHIRDARRTTFTTPNQTLSIQPPFKIPLMVWALIGLIAIVVLYFLFMRSNKKIEQEQEELVQSTKQQMAQQRGVPIARTTPVAPPARPRTRSIVTPKPAARKSRIKIKNIGAVSRNQEIDNESFLHQMNKGKYVQLDLSKLWSNSAIAEVFLNSTCIKKLHYFLQKENLDSIKEEVEDAIPEIGGFLLGRYTWMADKKQYLVSLDEFVAVSSEGLSNYQWEVSTESLVRDLGSAQDRFPDLCVLGWFHTHPGHGLFLSKPDLVIHNGFFREKYQLAMEIDSMTDNLDTGFFTRTRQGAINNSVRKRLEWFSWNEIERTVES